MYMLDLHYKNYIRDFNVLDESTYEIRMNNYGYVFEELRHMYVFGHYDGVRCLHNLYPLNISS